MGACACGGDSVSGVYVQPLGSFLEALKDGLLDLAALDVIAQEAAGQPPNETAAVLKMLFPLALKAKADKRPGALEAFDLCSAALLSSSGETLAEFVSPKLLPQLLKAIGPAKKTPSGKEEQSKGSKEVRIRILCETLSLWVDALPEEDDKSEKMVHDARARLESVGFIEENPSIAATSRGGRQSAEAYFKILSDHAKEPRIVAAAVRAANADGQLGQLSLLAAGTAFSDSATPSKPSLFEAFLSAVLRTFGSSLRRQIGTTLNKIAETLPALRKSPVRDAAALARDAEKVVRAVLEDLQQHWNKVPLGGFVVVCDLIQTLQGVQEGGRASEFGERPSRSPGKQRAPPPEEDDTSDSENEAMARLEKGGAGSPMLPLGERCAFELVRLSVPTKPPPKQTFKVHSAWMKHVIPLVFLCIAKDGAKSKALRAKVVDEIQKVGSKLRPVSRATLRELAKHAKDSELANFCNHSFLQRQVCRDLEILKLGPAAAPEEQQTAKEEQLTAKEEQQKRLSTMFGDDEDDQSDEEGDVRRQSLAIMSRTEGSISDEIDEKLMHMFRLCDRNGDGMMGRMELIEVCRERLDVAAFFGEDGSGEMINAIFEHVEAYDGYTTWDELLSAFGPEDLEEALHRAANAPHVHGSMLDGEEEDDDDEDQEGMMHHGTNWDAKQECGDEDGLETFPGERSKTTMLSQASLSIVGHRSSSSELTDWQEEAEEEDDDLYANDEELSSKEAQAPGAPKQTRAEEVHAEAVIDQKLREIFNRCDRNGDGRVNKRELIKVCANHKDVADMLNLPQKIRQEDGSRDEFERIFQGIDANQDREIDWPEFKAFCVTYARAGEAVSDQGEFVDNAVRPSERCPEINQKRCPETPEVKHVPAPAKELQIASETAPISQAMPADSNSASCQAMLTDTVAAGDTHPERSAIHQAVLAEADMMAVPEKKLENVERTTLDVSAAVQAVLASPSAAESKPTPPAANGSEQSGDHTAPPPAFTSSPAPTLPRLFTDNEIQSLVCSPDALLESAIGGKSSQVQWSDGEQSGSDSQPLHSDFQETSLQKESPAGGHKEEEARDALHDPSLMEDIRHDGIFGGAMHWFKDHIPMHAAKKPAEASSCKNASIASPEIGIASEAKMMYSSDILHQVMGSGVGMSLTEATHLPNMESASSATPGGSSVSSHHSDSLSAQPPGPVDVSRMSSPGHGPRPGARVPLSAVLPKQVADHHPAESQALDSKREPGAPLSTHEAIAGSAQEPSDVPAAVSEPALGAVSLPVPATEPLPTAAAVDRVAVPEPSAGTPLPAKAATAEKLALPETPGERPLSAEREAAAPEPQLTKAAAAPEVLAASAAMVALYDQIQQLNQRTASLEGDNKQLLQHLSAISSFYEQAADSRCEEIPADVEQHLPVGPYIAQEQQHDGPALPQGYDGRFAPQPRAVQQGRSYQPAPLEGGFAQPEVSMQRAAPPRESPRREPSLAPGVLGAPVVNISFGGTPGEQSRVAGPNVENIRPSWPPMHSMNMGQASDWSGLPPQNADPSGMWSGLGRQAAVDTSMLPAPVLQRTMMPAEAAMLAAAQGHGFVAPGPQNASGAQLYYPVVTAIPQQMSGTAPPQQVVLPAAQVATAIPQQMPGTAPPQQVVLPAAQVYSIDQNAARQQSAPPFERPTYPLSRTVLDSTLLSTSSSVSTPVPPQVAELAHQDHNFRFARTAPLSKPAGRGTSEMVAALVAAATQQDASRQQQRDEQSDREWVKSAEASLLTVELGSEVRSQIGSEVRALASELRLAGQAFTSELQSACETFQSAQRSLVRQTSMPSFNALAHSELPSPHQMNSASTYSGTSAQADWAGASNTAGMLAGMSASGMQGPPMLSGPPLGLHDVLDVQVPPHAAHSLHAGPPLSDFNPSLDYSAGMGITTAVPAVPPLPRSAFLPTSSSPAAVRGSAGRRAAQPRAQPSQPRAAVTTQKAGFAGKLRKLDTKLQSLDARFRELG